MINFRIRVLIILLALSFSFSGIAKSTSSINEVEKILEKHIEAMGGKEKWKHLKSYRQTYTKENGLTLTITCKMPDKITIHFQKDNLDVMKAYDGKHGYIIKNETYMPMRPGEIIEMAEEAQFYSDLMMAFENGQEVEHLGTEAIDNTPCIKLKLKKSSNDEQLYWINSKTYLIEQTGEYSEDSAHEGIYYKTRLSDYRNVDGFMFPFKQALIANDEAPRYSVIDKTEVNFECTEKEFQYQPNSVANLIRYWKDRYAEDRLAAFTFEQETVQIKDNHVRDTSIWYEAVQYPDQFRIDLGNKDDQNINLFRNDSIYVLRQGQLVRQSKKIQTSLLLEGALYDLPVDSTLAKLEFSNINTSVFSSGIYEGRPAYIIGALEGDKKAPQIWLDSERRIVLRKISKTRNGGILDACYADFIDFNGHWIESWVEFYIDGKLVQTERYRDINVNPVLKAEIFDPSVFQNHYWY